MGSRDPDGAAQEAVKRSLASPVSRAAVEYYFAEVPPASAPAWSLLQLLGWLHGVLRYVVKEERARARFRLELPAGPEALQIVDPSPDPLASAIDAEMQRVVRDCLAGLDRDYRSALQLRLEGLKYADIARRLGVNQNTLATWLRRGALEFARLARERLAGRRPASGGAQVETLRHA